MHGTSCDMVGPDTLSLSSEQTWKQTIQNAIKNDGSSAATKLKQLMRMHHSLCKFHIMWKVFNYWLKHLPSTLCYTVCIDTHTHTILQLISIASCSLDSHSPVIPYLEHPQDRLSLYGTSGCITPTHINCHKLFTPVCLCSPSSIIWYLVRAFMPTCLYVAANGMGPINKGVL